MIQVVEKMGKQSEIPKLVEYVNTRAALLSSLRFPFYSRSDQGILFGSNVA